MNNGQLVALLRAAFLVPAEGFNKVEGKPFKVAEIVEAIRGAAGGMTYATRGFVSVPPLHTVERGSGGEDTEMRS